MSTIAGRATRRKSFYTRADMRALLAVNEDELTDLIMTKKAPKSDYIFNGVGRWKPATVTSLLERLATRRTEANLLLGACA